jgi:hypothetical protein
MLKEDLKFITTRAVEYANRKRFKGPNLKKGGMVYLLRKNIKTKRPSRKLDHTKLGLFKIKEKLGLVTYELNLSREIRIYLRFYVSLLKLAPRKRLVSTLILLNKEN